MRDVDEFPTLVLCQLVMGGNVFFGWLVICWVGCNTPVDQLLHGHLEFIEFTERLCIPSRVARGATSPPCRPYHCPCGALIFPRYLAALVLLVCRRTQLHEEQKHKVSMKHRHDTEHADAHRAFALEQDQHRHMWDLKMQDYEDSVQEQVARYKHQHLEKLEKFFAEADIKRPKRPQFSKQLLNQRKIQDTLAKQVRSQQQLAWPVPFASLLPTLSALL